MNARHKIEQMKKMIETTDKDIEIKAKILMSSVDSVDMCAGVANESAAMAKMAAKKSFSKDDQKIHLQLTIIELGTLHLRRLLFQKAQEILEKSESN